MERPTCKTCPYAFCLDCGQIVLESECCCSEGKHMALLCHRFPPSHKTSLKEQGVLGPDEVDELEYWFPRVLPDDFCGEHPDFKAYIASIKPGGSSGNSVLDQLLKTIEKC